MKEKKSSIIILLVFFMVLGFCSCSEPTPEEITKNFITAMYTGNFDEAKKHSNSATVKIIEAIEKGITPEKYAQIQKSIVNIKEMKCTTQSDSAATCKCLVIINENRHDERRIVEVHNLVKRNNKWVIALNDNINK